MMKRRILRSVHAKLAVAILLLLTSCQSPSLFKKEPEKQLSGQLKVVLTQSEINILYLNQHPIKDKIEQFTERHPNVTVDVELKRSFDYSRSKPVDYRLLYGGETPYPDIIELSPNQIKLAMLDHVEDLSPYFSNEFHNEWQGDYRQLIEGARVYDRYYLLPIRSFPSMMFYDKKLFEEYGFLDPQDGWTWQQFVEIAITLKREGHKILFPHYLTILEPIIYGLGGTMASEELKFSGYLDSEQTIDAVQTLRDLDLFDFGVSLFDKENFRLGMTQLNIHIGSLRNQLLRNSDLAIAPMPTFEHGDNKLPAAISGLAITKDSPNKELAWELLKYIAGPTEEDALDIAAYYTLFASEPGFVLTPKAEDHLILERLRKDMSRAIGGSMAMTTNISPFGHYEGGILRNAQLWEKFKAITNGESVEKSLKEIVDSIEREVANLYY